ncbi:hypothetical protein [Rubritalea tangerina]|uniref:hypothetical protein n=1 Tax=Rubritalea tangerina TaxID=430798 RepID=UPI0036165123
MLILPQGGTRKLHTFLTCKPIPQKNTHIPFRSAQACLRFSGSLMLASGGSHYSQ